jgi:hypothetical protein
MQCLLDSIKNASSGESKDSSPKLQLQFYIFFDNGIQGRKLTPFAEQFIRLAETELEFKGNYALNTMIERQYF